TDALAQLEKLAREQGFAAAVIRPYPLSYQLVQEWIATLPEKGIVLAPLSAQTGY
ncbi:MAG: divergent polysaccharide deacetylase family protein, partial [Alphaproteobacteria bacterium]|nr:divergent polysaccharide deacetylase family protein [Alphaproteobacteria bacterium]